MIFNFSFNSRLPLSFVLKASFSKRFYPGPKFPKFSQITSLFLYPSSTMAAGTKIYGEQKIRLNNILYLHNYYLRNLKDPKNSSTELLEFIEETFFIDPKLTQHILSIYYPTYSFSLDDLRFRYPKIGITNPNSSVYASFDIVFPTIVAKKIMLKNPIFKEGHISVLGYSDNFKPELTKIAYNQTEQPNPDYYYVYNKDNNKWERYLDLKTGKFKVNTGHIVCAREGQIYEDLSKFILVGQKLSYASNSEIQKELTSLFDNKNLTWGERNEAFQLFLKDNLHKYPTINPSFVLKAQLYYEVNNMRPHKMLSSIVESSTCFESLEESEKTLSKSLVVGGSKCYNNYIDHLGNSPNIKKALLDMISETQNMYNL